jgi:ketosteroid isomerase-like protein
MAATNYRNFFETVLTHLTKGDVDKFFAAFDPNVTWNIHGDNPWKGNYRSLDAVKKMHSDYKAAIKEAPRTKLLSLVVEGATAAAFLADECVGKDGKKYTIEYFFVMHAAVDATKIVKVENFIDSKQLMNILSQSTPMRKTA